jgi:hypothetical protein
MKRRRLIVLVLLIAGAVTLGDAALGQAPQGPPAGVASAATAPDISGFWELSFDSRKVPAASLLATVTRAKLQTRQKGDAYAIRWCNLLGVPFIMDPGRPLDIRQGPSAVIIVPENASSPRYLYLNRTAHVDADVFDPSTNGDSIARWEGDTLVVDTVGFHGQHGITAIPGGGFRTEKSRLVERYRLLENGAILSVVFTWTDPTVFKSAHSYEFRYYRLPVTYEPRQWLPCDPYNEERSRFLDPPPAAAKPGTRTTAKE